MSETNADIFIQKFKELEAAIRSTLGLNDWDSITKAISGKEEYAGIKDNLKYCQDIRNILQHKVKIDGEYPVQPTDELIEMLDDVTVRFTNRQKADKIMIPRKDIFCRKLEDNIFATIPYMRNSAHNHVPILGQSGNVVGVFTAVSFLKIMADRKDHKDDKSLIFQDVTDYISFDHHATEEYRFIKGNLYVDELKVLFENLYSNGKRLSMVFITDNGKEDGKLQGIITPWDILGKEQ